MKESLYSVNDDLWNSKNNDNESVCVSEIPPSQKPWKFWPRLYLSSSGTWVADGGASTRGSFQLRRSPAPLLDNPSRWASSIILENFIILIILKSSWSNLDHPCKVDKWSIIKCMKVDNFHVGHFRIIKVDSLYVKLFHKIKVGSFHVNKFSNLNQYLVQYWGTWTPRRRSRSWWSRRSPSRWSTTPPQAACTAHGCTSWGNVKMILTDHCC